MSEAETNNRANVVLDAEGEQAFMKLSKIAAILQNDGLKLKDWAMKKDAFAEVWNSVQRTILTMSPGPVVFDGADGIRVIYQNKEWIVTYTNGFESITHPTVVRLNKLFALEGIEAR